MQMFLAKDNYDHNHDPKVISATSLIRPLRQLILASRVNQEDAVIDIGQLLPSRIGSAIHDGIERAWSGDYKATLKLLGYPEAVINRIVINKPVEELTESDIPIYFEQRIEREISGYKVSGKFDAVTQGQVSDYKTTGVFTAMNNTNDEKYRLQLSIYRWLNPKMITNDQGVIEFIFTDWSAARAKQESNYPQSRTQRRTLDLLSLAETERYIKTKLQQFEQYKDSPEGNIPECTADDLWRSEPVFKYYKDPNKLGRSTKNFDNRHDANLRLAQEGVGVVLEKPGMVTACRYCSGFDLCQQKDRLIANGELIV